MEIQKYKTYRMDTLEESFPERNKSLDKIIKEVHEQFQALPVSQYLSNRLLETVMVFGWEQ